MGVEKGQFATVSSIAKSLDLSAGTVSFVLSGQGKKRGISDSTAERVRQTANEMGYVPNQWAQNLRGRKTGNISVLFGDLLMGWADRVMKGVIEVLGEGDYTPVMSLHDRMPLLKHTEGKIRRREIVSIIHRRDEGVICHANPAASRDYVELINRKIPLVFIGDLLSDMTGLENVSSITWDCFSATKTVVQHLIKTGRRRIGFIGARHGVRSDDDRYRAYEETLREASLPINNKWIMWGPFYHIVSQKMVEAAFAGSEKPDAFFVLNDAMAFDILEMFDNMGIRVPDDVAVVGMGDLSIPRINRFGITTMREPLEDIGRGAAEIVIELISNPTQTPIHRKIDTNELKIRRTT